MVFRIHVIFPHPQDMKQKGDYFTELLKNKEIETLYTEFKSLLSGSNEFRKSLQLDQHWKIIEENLPGFNANKMADLHYYTTFYGMIKHFAASSQTDKTAKITDGVADQALSNALYRYFYEDHEIAFRNWSRDTFFNVGEDVEKIGTEKKPDYLQMAVDMLMGGAIHDLNSKAKSTIAKFGRNFGDALEI